MVMYRKVASFIMQITMSDIVFKSYSYTESCWMPMDLPRGTASPSDRC